MKKAEAVNFPLLKYFFGRKQLIVIRLVSVFSSGPVTCRCRPDIIVQAKGTAEKSNLVNNFFSNIGEKLAGSFQPQYLSHLATSTKIVPCVNNIALSRLAIERKLANLKTNKATGPDDISPKIVKEAGDALLNSVDVPLQYEFERWLRL